MAFLRRVWGCCGQTLPRWEKAVLSPGNVITPVAPAENFEDGHSEVRKPQIPVFENDKIFSSAKHSGSGGSALASTRATIHADIHRRLAIPETPEWIANAVGVAVSTVYRHRSGACKCDGNSGAARKDNGLESFGDIDIEAELKAMGFPTLEQQLEELEEIARALGLPSYEEQMEVESDPLLAELAELEAILFPVPAPVVDAILDVLKEYK